MREYPARRLLLEQRQEEPCFSMGPRNVLRVEWGVRGVLCCLAGARLALNVGQSEVEMTPIVAAGLELWAETSWSPTHLQAPSPGVGQDLVPFMSSVLRGAVK